jgi:cyclopropane-fatty-acyl-phospholipid synthase
MTYTAARFEGTEDEDKPAQRLDDAQTRKIHNHLCAIDAGPGNHILDIGCGWGSLMWTAVNEYGAASALGLTLSKEQHEYVNALAEPRIKAQLVSYEHFSPKTPFDGIASVGSFEAFSKAGLTADQRSAIYAKFFALCYSWLRHRRKLSLQTMCWGMNSESEKRAIKVQSYFPESDLPEISEVISASKERFELLNMENRRRDYQLTLESWSNNLERYRDEALKLVTPERFEFYRQCFRGGAALFRARRFYLCRFVFQRR